MTVFCYNVQVPLLATAFVFLSALAELGDTTLEHWEAASLLVKTCLSENRG